MGEFAASIERSKAKSVSALGGALPPDHAGALPLDSAIARALRARHAPPLRYPKYAAAYM